MNIFLRGFELGMSCLIDFSGLYIFRNILFSSRAAADFFSCSHFSWGIVSEKLFIFSGSAKTDSGTSSSHFIG